MKFKEWMEAIEKEIIYHKFYSHMYSNSFYTESLVHSYIYLINVIYI